MRAHHPILLLGAILPFLLLLAGPAPAQVDFEREPFLYHETPSHDPVAELQAKMDAGKVSLEYDADHGYLPDVLRHLNISPATQTLVFSKTSFQLRKISPSRPRALYFNDDVYIGWVQEGDVVEVSAVDPRLGAVFYTLTQDPAEPARFIRDKGQCLTCHASSRTQGVPGHLMRSVFAGDDGQPHFGSGTYTIDQTSPFEHRWGGWYVSGTHGDMRHMGNVIAPSKSRPEDIDRDEGANITDLSTLLDVSPYLRPTSDIVALLVLVHQLQMHNLLTAAYYEAVSASHYDSIMNEALDRPDDYQSDSAKRRIASVGDKLIRYLLMSDESPLPSPIEGTSPFAEQFQSQGPRDSRGRSLRELDLRTRLLKYPCSYLIYSESFDALPDPVLRYVSRKLSQVLDGVDDSREFTHLSAGDRASIREILHDTKPGFLDQPAAAQSGE